MKIWTCSDRTPNPGVRPFLFKCVALLVILVGGFLLWYGNQLIVALIPEGGKKPITFPADEWRYHYTHSVQLTPVDEYFKVNGVDDMTMTHTVFQSLGVGLPYAPYEGQFHAMKKEGKFDLQMNRPYKVVRFRPAIQAKPYIAYKDTIYDLCDLYGSGTLVEVRAMKRYQFWLRHSAVQ